MAGIELNRKCLENPESLSWEENNDTEMSKVWGTALK